MKTILEIDHSYYVLPDSANLNTLLKMLGGAKQVTQDYQSGSGFTYTIKGDPRIEVKVVNEKDVLDPKARKRLPEKASPDCHGPGV
jgi:hypothetical protein